MRDLRFAILGTGFAARYQLAAWLEVDPAPVTCEMSYASRLEHDRFPETYALIDD